MRKLIFNLHLYLSLASGVVLLVVALTGCLLVFEVPMDRWLDREVSFVPEGRGRAAWADLLSAVKRGHPGQQVTELDVAGPGTTVIAKLNGIDRVFVDPYSARIVGERKGQPPSYWLRHIHRDLVGGAAGSLLVQISTFVALFLSLSGIYLWWPLKRIRVKWGASLRRVSFDLHHAAGFLASVFIFILAVTGLVKGFGDQLQPMVNRVAGEPASDRKAMISAVPVDGAQAMSLDRALDIAAGQLPGAVLARVTTPKGPKGTYTFTMKYPGDSTAPGRSWVVVDQYNGAVLGKQDARTAPAAARFQIVNREIHVGGIFGIPSRAFAFLVSFATIVQILTGFYMWWKKRVAAQAKQGVVSAAGAAARI
jgi:uncharacterized iron-regulated membrane protein